MTDPRLTLLHWFWTGQWRASPGRAATAVLAIAIGVALALAIHLVNRSALDEFGTAIAVVNGDAQLQVEGATGAFDEAIYARIASLSGVAAASPVIETDILAASDANPAPIPLRVVGLDVMRAASVTPALMPRVERLGQDGSRGERNANRNQTGRERSPDGADRVDGSGSGSALFADDTIFLSAAAMQALQVRIGDLIEIIAGLAGTRLRVAGTVPGAASGQRIAVMDIGTAQWRLGWLGRLSRVDLRLQAGADRALLEREIAAQLRGALRLTSPASSRQRMSNLSRAYRVNLNVLALVALFTGGFIVYATMSLAMVRQLPHLALLGVLGGSRRLLAGIVLGQGVVLGLSGAVLGVAGGFGLAAAMLALVGGDLGGGYFRGARPALSIDIGAVLLFGALGVAVGLAGSAMPARRLRRMEPARALRSGLVELSLGHRHGIAWAALLFAAGAVLLLLPPVAGLPLPAYLAIVCWLLAGIAFVPVITEVLGRLLAHRAFAWRRPAAWLAVQRIAGAPGSAAAALSGVVASVALASAMAIMVHSFRDSVSNWLDSVLPADLYARSSAGAAEGALTPDVQRQLSQVAEVARADFLRIVELSLDPERPPISLLARGIDARNAASQLPVTGTVLPAPPGAIPIYVSEAMVDLYGFTPGRFVTLPIGRQPGKQARLFVSAVWRDYARQHGAITISRDHWRELTGDDSANNVAIWIAEGFEPAQVIEAIGKRIPALRALEFGSSREIRQVSLRIFDRSFALTYVLEAIAIVVGLFGVAATYAGEALARAREFGMLRHLGLTRAAITRMFAIESGLLILTSVIWGALLGVLIAMVLIHRVNPQSFHWTMDVAWPVPLLAGSAMSLILVGMLSAVLASRGATGSAPVRAVREDW